MCACTVEGGLKHLEEAEMLRQSWESWWEGGREGGGSKEGLGEKSKGIKRKREGRETAEGSLQSTQLFVQSQIELLKSKDGYTPPVNCNCQQQLISSSYQPSKFKLH